MSKRRQPSGEVPALAFRFRAPITVAFVVAWMLIVAYGYREHLVIIPSLPAALLGFGSLALPRVTEELGGRLPWLAALWLVAVALGALWLRFLSVRARRSEALLLAAGLGFGTLSLLLLLAGAAHLYTPAVLKAALWAAAVTGLAGARWWWRWLPREEAGRERLGPWEAAALLVMAAAAALEVCGALTPEIFYDSLVYHLALPKLYLIYGGVYAIPHNLFSGTPQAVQLLYGLCLSVSDEKLASLLHLSFSMAAAAVVYVIGRRLHSRPAGLAAALAFFTCPMALYAGWACGVDLAAAFLAAGAFSLMLRDLVPAGQEPAAGMGGPAAAGLLLGFACGVKYNVLPLTVVLVAVYAWQSRALGRSWRPILVMAACAFAVFVPWLVKDAALLGNPLYPYLRGIFGDPGWIADWAAFKADVGRPALDWRELLSQPWTTSVGMWPMGDWPGPLFIALVPWLLLLRPQRPPVKAVIASAAGGYLAWALATRWVRYMLPIMPLLALCAAMALEGGGWPRWLRRLGWAAVLYGGIFNVQVAFHHGTGMGQWQYLAGATNRSDYLKTQRVTYPLPYYSAAEFINRELPPRAKVLVLGESRTYYIERDCVASTVFDYNPFWKAAAVAREGEDLLAKVRAMGVTHVLLSAQQLIFRKDAPSILPREAAARPAFKDFWTRHLKQLFEDRQDSGPNPRWLAVYEVVDKPNAAPTPDPVSAVLAALSAAPQR